MSLELANGGTAPQNADADDVKNRVVLDDLLAYCAQSTPSTKENLSAEQILREAELQFALSHASSWCQGGFATNTGPGHLWLCTPRRLLSLDSRQRDVASTLFSLAPEEQRGEINASGRHFNPSEGFFAATTLDESPYMALATDFNVLLVDRRWPGRYVSRWTNALRNPPSYIKCMTAPDGFPAEVCYP